MESLVRRHPFPYANPAISGVGVGVGVGEVVQPFAGMTEPAHPPLASCIGRSDRLVEQDAAFIVRGW